MQSHIADDSCITIISNVTSLLFNGSSLTMIADEIEKTSGALFSTPMVLLPTIYQDSWCLVALLNIHTIVDHYNDNSVNDEPLPMMLLLHPDKERIRKEHFFISERVRSLFNCLWQRRNVTSSMKPFTSRSISFHVLDGVCRFYFVSLLYYITSFT